MSVAQGPKERTHSLDFIAGALAGATATSVTYPLEVLQTRLQSSTFNVRKVCSKVPLLAFEGDVDVINVRRFKLVTYARNMVQSEGYSLFSRGFAVNVMAVSLSKAIYFPVYSYCKRCFRRRLGDGKSESTLHHIASAAVAGFVNCSVTNPIWFLRTRLLLEPSASARNWLQLPKRIYQIEGIRTFYSGLAASYLGIVGTVMYFAVYEYLRGFIRERESSRPASSGAKFYLSDCMIAAAVSKTAATVIAYPHEVLRTRARELDNGQKSFSRLIRRILKNEGWQAFYGGLGTHLIRQVPHSAILFLTFESVIYLGRPD